MFLTFLFVASFLVNLVYSSTDVVVYVYPNIVETNVDKSFEVEVRIANVVGLYGYELKLYFNKTLLQATSLSKGTFFPDYNILEFKKEISNVQGYVWYAVSLLNPETPKSGSGSLVKVSFKALSEGNSSLSLKDVMLGDINANPISFVSSDGFVKITKQAEQPTQPPIPSPIIVKFDVIPVTVYKHVYLELPFTLKTSIKAVFIVQPTPLDNMTIGSDAIVNWWVTVNGSGTVVLNQTISIYVITDEPKTVDVTFSLPEGEYTFHAKVVGFGSYRVQENLSSYSFKVENLLNYWLFAEKNILYFVLIGVIIIVVLVLYKRRKSYYV
jgi:hypothetical protein